MKLDSRHHRLIQLLLDGQKTQDEMAVEVGVDARTLRRWLNDDTFQAAYREALDKWTKDLSELPFVNKKRRIQELQRLYRITRDSYIDKVLHAKRRVYDPESKSYIEEDAYFVDEDGQVLKDEEGNPVSVLAVRKMNVDTKAAILKQIKEEVEPKMFRAGTREKNPDGSERVIYFEVGTAPGAEADGLPSEIPWGDASLKLPDEL